MLEQRTTTRATAHCADPGIPVDVYRAQGALAERLNIDPERAAATLELDAATRAISVPDAARQVLHGERGAFAYPVPDPWGSC